MTVHFNGQTKTLRIWRIVKTNMIWKAGFLYIFFTTMIWTTNTFMKNITIPNIKYKIANIKRSIFCRLYDETHLIIVDSFGGILYTLARNFGPAEINLYIASFILSAMEKYTPKTQYQSKLKKNLWTKYFLKTGSKTGLERNDGKKVIKLSFGHFQFC